MSEHISSNSEVIDIPRMMVISAFAGVTAGLAIALFDESPHNTKHVYPLVGMFTGLLWPVALPVIGLIGLVSTLSVKT